MEEFPIKPLDFVLTEKKDVAIVKEVNANGDCSIEFIYRNPGQLGLRKVAWYTLKELTVLTSLPLILAQMSAHPFGNGEVLAKRIFKTKK